MIIFPPVIEKSDHFIQEFLLHHLASIKMLLKSRNEKHEAVDILVVLHLGLDAEGYLEHFIVHI